MVLLKTDQMLPKVKGMSQGFRDARILMYSHDTFGLGHIRRCMTIANHLVETFQGAHVLIIPQPHKAHKIPLVIDMNAKTIKPRARRGRRHIFTLPDDPPELDAGNDGSASGSDPESAGPITPEQHAVDATAKTTRVATVELEDVPSLGEDGLAGVGKGKGKVVEEGRAPDATPVVS